MRARYWLSALALAGALYGGWRWRSARKALPAPPVESAAPPSGGGEAPGLGGDWQAAAGAAKGQIQAAQKGQRLDDYRKAEGRECCFNPGTTLAEAHFKVAFWLAVASRLLGADPGLLDAAIKSQNAGVKAQAMRASGPPEAVYQAAIPLLRERADRTQNPGVRAVAKMVEVGAGRVAFHKELDRQRSVSGQVADAARASAEDVGTAAQFLRGLVTGEKPKSMGSLEWTLSKWGTRAAVAAALLLGLKVAFGGQIQAARVAARGALGTAAQKLQTLQEKV